MQGHRLPNQQLSKSLFLSKIYPSLVNVLTECSKYTISLTFKLLCNLNLNQTFPPESFYFQSKAIGKKRRIPDHSTGKSFSALCGDAVVFSNWKVITFSSKFLTRSINDPNLVDFYKQLKQHPEKCSFEKFI